MIVVLVLAACSSTPTRRESAPPISTSHEWKPPSSLPAFIDHSVGEEEISIQAMSLVGVPYRWGGNTPDSGFDCSGLVHYVVARAARVDLPRTTADMSLVGEAIRPDEVATGDLIFFNTTGRPHSHVGIYVGGYRFVNAPSTGGTVRIDYISNPYWAKRFDGIRRVAGNHRSATPFDAPQWVASTAPDPNASTLKSASSAPALGEDAPSSANSARAAATRESPAVVQRPLVDVQPGSTGYASVEPTTTEGHKIAMPVETSTAPVADAHARRIDAGDTGVSNASPETNTQGAGVQRVSFSAAGAAARSSHTATGSDPLEPPPPSRADAQTQAAAEHASPVTDPIAAFAEHPDAVRHATEAGTAGNMGTDDRAEAVGVRRAPGSASNTTVSNPEASNSAAVGATSAEARETAAGAASRGATARYDAPAGGTRPSAEPAAAATDDPIARFANGN
ncbi:NlpC/P60 family protein [Pararobbsia silviterrae]|uniref:NlpC/P60 family protein n=1 Tax=Pararobbsia silviterrae TaxID=1792498 RepID=UPI003B832AC7